MNAGHTLTPKQYIQARRREVRDQYPEYSLKEIAVDMPEWQLMTDWVASLWDAARRGETLAPVVLDRLFEYSEAAFWQLFKNYGRTLLPLGYLNPKARAAGRSDRQHQTAE